MQYVFLNFGRSTNENAHCCQIKNETVYVYIRISSLSKRRPKHIHHHILLNAFKCMRLELGHDNVSSMILCSDIVTRCKLFSRAGNEKFYYNFNV